MMLRVLTLLLSLAWTLAMPALAQIQPASSQREQTIRNEAVGVPGGLAFSASGRDLMRAIEQGDLRQPLQAGTCTKSAQQLAVHRRIASVDEEYRSDWNRRWRRGQSRDDPGPA